MKTPHRARFLARPSSLAGRVSVTLFLIAIVLVVLDASVIEALSLNGTLSSTFTATFKLGVGACVFAAGLSGASAIVFKQERSWAVFVATLIPLVLIGGELVQLWAAAPR